MALRSIFVKFWLVGLASSLRRAAKEVAKEATVGTVGCPVLAALTSAGHLRPDSKGRVEDSMMTAALQQTGTSAVFAGFQTAGIVGFWKSDVHQETRLAGPGSPSGTKYVNIRTMNPGDACTKDMGNTNSGYPCNINTQYQQHGYSTKLLDPRGGSNPQRRFKAVFGRLGVMSSIRGVKERVMTVAGLGKLLGRARSHGDLSGENSLNRTFGLSESNMKNFHPSIADRSKYMPLAQWQAQLAWAGFWNAFSRKKNGVSYMPKSDLESLFLEGRFPVGWQKRNWGFGTVLRFIPNFNGTGAGDEWVRVVKGITKKVGRIPDEQTWYGALLQTLAGLGAFNDKVSNPRPR